MLHARDSACQLFHHSVPQLSHLVEVLDPDALVAAVRPVVGLVVERTRKSVDGHSKISQKEAVCGAILHDRTGD